MKDKKSTKKAISSEIALVTNPDQLTVAMKKNILAHIQTGKRPVALRQLQNPAILGAVVELIKEHMGLSEKEKINFRELSYHLGVTPGSRKDLTPEGYDLITNIGIALKKTEKQVAVAMTKSFNADVKYLLVLPEIAEPDMELLELLEVPVSFLRTAYLYRTGYAKPKETSYTTHYGETNVDIAEGYVHLMSYLNKDQIDIFWESANKKYLYLLFVAEIGEYESASDIMTDFWAAVKYNDTVPMEFPLIHWLQEHVPMLYEEVIAEIQNLSHFESREEFKMTRNVSDHDHSISQIKKESDESGDRWFSDLMRNIEEKE